MSNGEVYYKAVSFYLEEHPDLLVDLLKVPRRACMLVGATHWRRTLLATRSLHCGQYHLPLTELTSRGRASAELSPQPRTGAK